MDAADQTAIHEAMEQQTISITKAGIQATLNARTSILAAANPIESRYNPRLSIVENIQLPPTLLSRFDLIYLMLDPESPDGDALLARHLVSLYETEEARRDQARVPYAPSQLAEYISYARAHVNPVISDDARALIVEGYVEMRKLGLRGGHGKKTITATTRQLESIIRLSEAHARMRLCYSVEPQDVQVRRGRGARRRPPRGEREKEAAGRARKARLHARARARRPCPPRPPPAGGAAPDSRGHADGRH
jgi:DNA replication licensing factor MCM4